MFKTQQNGFKMNAMFVFVFLLPTVLLNQGAFSQTIVISPQNKTVELGKSVVLECQFQEEVSCMWGRGLEGTPEQIVGRYRFVNGEAVSKADCSIEISNLAQEDLGAWSCFTFRFTPLVGWLSEQKIPSQPKIYLMGKPLTDLIFPIPTSQVPATNLSCISEKGNPLPKLSWELDGQRIAGHTENITVIEDQLFSTLLTWIDGDWSRFGQNNGPLKCILEHPAYGQPQAATVIFIQEYQTKNTQIEVDGLSGDSFELGHNEQLVFICKPDGQPKPSITWEFLPDGESDWTVANVGDDRLVVKDQRDGRYRCSASNKHNRNVPVNSQELYVKGKKTANCNCWNVLTIVICAGSGAALLIIGAGFGALFKNMHQKRKTSKAHVDPVYEEVVYSECTEIASRTRKNTDSDGYLIVMHPLGFNK